MSNLIGPSRTASNHYAYARMADKCTECQCCGEPWHYNAARGSRGNLPVNIGGRIYSARKAMYMAAFPDKRLIVGRWVSSKCRNPNCINPEMLVQLKPGDVLKSHYEHGIRTKAQAAAHLIKMVRSRSKLSDTDVDRIRNDDRKGTAAAHEWGISAEHYNAIQRGDARRSHACNPFAGLMPASPKGSTP